MANNKMLIDATHPEETRVVVLRNNRVEEFDYESAARKLLRGNIYLAKVTRVEPSLQAAFIDYGGNRHGFLAFNEIHPDYYQIPMADRQALLDEEAAAEAREEAEADARAERMARRRRPRRGRPAPGDGPVEAGAEAEDAENAEGEDLDTNLDAEEGADDESDDQDQDREADNDDEDDEADATAETDDDDSEDDDTPPRTIAATAETSGDRLTEELSQPEAAPEDEPEGATSAQSDAEDADRRDAGETGDSPAEVGLVENEGVEIVAPVNGEAEAIEQVGSEDALEELPSRPRRRPRSYKIQEVIKRRQIILVQVVKEERGTKGAALTTYLSLAGRYTVLMPNTARGGGISRKITNPQDRKRLKAIAAELDVPEGMGLIIRTAGAARTKQEIKRDFEYLLRLWESVRDLTLESTAPSLVYEEGNLIKRSIRDLYDKDVDEVVVAGAKAFQEAHDFMSMLMPSHARNVIAHKDPEPLFTRYGIERQLNAMFSPYVTLRSGGYLVINQTEALVAVDVNSGKATREFSIEETALHTNLEAADEIARQLKLRDLAGLIVIDFIDMEEKRNNRAVERRLKDALRFDRARIQLGRISHFGLMEMSRQRLRTGVLEGSTSQCPHCQGTGIIRSTESVALAVLRGLEDALMQGARASLVATTTAQVALYILNNKRQFINDMEAHNGVGITVQASDKLQGANFTIERGHAAPAQPSRRPERAAVNMEWGFDGDTEPQDAEEEGAIETAGSFAREGNGSPEGREDRGGRRRRRRRGRRGGSGERHEGERGAQRSHDNRQPPADDADIDLDEAGMPPPGYSDQPDADFPARATGEARDTEPYDEDGEAGAPQDEGGRNGRRRRRGRRGGRRGRGRDRERTSEILQVEGAAHVTEEIIDDFGGAVMPDELTAVTEPMTGDETPAPEASSEAPTDQGRRRRREPRTEARTERTQSPAATPVEPTAEAQASEEAPPPPRRSLSSSTEPKLERVVVNAGEGAVEAAETQQEAPKRGWWQRRLGG